MLDRQFESSIAATSSSGPLVARRDHALGLGQTRAQDPHELCRRLRADLGPRVRQVVLDRRVREAEAVGGGLLRSGGQDGHDDADLAVRAARDVGPAGLR